MRTRIIAAAFAAVMLAAPLSAEPGEDRHLLFDLDNSGIPLSLFYYV